jgi:hypothetical protein
VPELIASAPLGSPAPLTLGGVTLAEADLGPITAIAPYPGQGAAVDRALKPLGLTFPAPNSQRRQGRCASAMDGPRTGVPDRRGPA